MNAANFSAQSAWLYSTELPNDCYLSSRVNTLLQPLYILATLEAIVVPISTFTFSIAISRRETKHNEEILVFSLIAINIAVAAAVLALKTLVQNPSLDMQAILRIRPDLSNGDVLAAWGNFIGRGMSLAVFIFSVIIGGFQIAVISAQHLIPSPKRLPKQFQPFIMEKHRETTAIGELEATTPVTEVVAGVNSGPLARLYDEYEKQ